MWGMNAKRLCLVEDFSFSVMLKRPTPSDPRLCGSATLARQVNDFLESTNTPGVFAVGDCAHMVNHPRPKAGVFAVRQVISAVTSKNASSQSSKTAVLPISLYRCLVYFSYSYFFFFSMVQ